jgi:16S rRNA (uracil1498-N3)-methyltransferase
VALHRGSVAVTRRFFVGDQDLATATIEFDRGLAHRLSAVLRSRPGDEITLFDGSGQEAVVRIDALSDRSGSATVLRRCEGKAEPRTRVHLYQSIGKSDRFEWVLEKATEIGVARIIPLIAARAVVRTAERGNRIDRWRRIVVEATEQCGRSAVPAVEAPQRMDAALRDAPGVILVPYEDAGEDALGVQRALDSEIDALFATSDVSVFIGPEGGFDPEEIAQAREIGASIVTLGARVLRSETAGLVAAALVLHTIGDLG